MTYEVHQSERFPDVWFTVAINLPGEGEIFGAEFYGPEAERRAREYAAWKNQEEQERRRAG